MPFFELLQGILSSVFLDGIFVKKWKMFPLTFSDIDKVLSADPLIQLAESKGCKGLSFSLESSCCKDT